MKLVMMIIGAIVAVSVQAQPDSSNSKAPIVSQVKRLSDEDLLQKKEGFFVTGLPEMEQNPINGTGLGATVFLYNNGYRSRDSLFAYTPYRFRLQAFGRVYFSGKSMGSLQLDIPYIFNSLWRLRLELTYDADPNFQYFGIGAHTRQPLVYTLDPASMPQTFSRFGAFDRQLRMPRQGRGSAFGEDPLAQYTDTRYNEVNYTSYLPALAIERLFMDGKLRTLFGFELLFVEVSAYDGLFSEEAHGTTGTSLPQGQTLLTQERNDPTRWQRYNIDPESYNGGRMGLLQIGLIYDTRDLETDPTRGILAEYAQEISDDWTGSEFSFSKHLLQLVHYSKIASPQKTRCVFAQRVALGYNRGTRIPWTEVLDQWSANYGGITALGGPMSMRGYRRGRFVAPVTCFINSELRFRFAQRMVWRQQLALSLVPFVDVGNVWDGLDKLDMQMWKWSVGSGLRLVWNQSTVLRADLAFSQEDRQFFFGFNHVF